MCGIFNHTIFFAAQSNIREVSHIRETTRTKRQRAVLVLVPPGRGVALAFNPLARRGGGRVQGLRTQGRQKFRQIQVTPTPAWPRRPCPSGWWGRSTGGRVDGVGRGSGRAAGGPWSGGRWAGPWPHRWGRLSGGGEGLRHTKNKHDLLINRTGETSKQRPFRPRSNLCHLHG